MNWDKNKSLVLGLEYGGIDFDNTIIIISQYFFVLLFIIWLEGRKVEHIQNILH